MITIQASHLNRAIGCPGSIRMPGDEIEPEAQSEAAREGTALHALLADILRTTAANPADFVGVQVQGVIITSEMAEAIETVTDAIRGDHGSDQTGVKTVCNWSIDQTFVNGRADHIHYDRAANILFIDDAKFGWRIVEAEGDWTLLSYAFGFCQQHRIAPDRIVMTVHQPRPHHEDGKSRAWELSWDEFEEWCGRLTQHVSNLTMQQLPGISDLVTGLHCYNCPAQARCPALRAAGMNVVEMSAVAFSDTIPTEEFAFMLRNLHRAQDRLTMLITAYENEGLHRVKAGAVIEGYAIENPLGHRFFKKEFSPEAIEALTGIDLLVKKLPTPAEAARRGVDETILALITDRARTGEKLKPININKRAKKAFGTQTGD